MELQYLTSKQIKNSISTTSHFVCTCAQREECRSALPTPSLHDFTSQSELTTLCYGTFFQYFSKTLNFENFRCLPSCDGFPFGHFTRPPTRGTEPWTDLRSRFNVWHLARVGIRKWGCLQWSGNHHNSGLTKFRGLILPPKNISSQNLSGKEIK